MLCRLLRFFMDVSQNLLYIPLRPRYTSANYLGALIQYINAPTHRSDVAKANTICDMVGLSLKNFQIAFQSFMEPVDFMFCNVIACSTYFLKVL